MIVETLLDFVIYLFMSAIAGFEVVKLPLEIIGVLTNVLQYGVWVVGADVMALVFGSVFGWWALKATAGLLIFLWKLIPLT